MLLLVMVESFGLCLSVSVSDGADIQPVETVGSQCTDDHTGWTRVAAIIAGKSTSSLVTDYLIIN